jgi:hypothetical protein
MIHSPILHLLNPWLEDKPDKELETLTSWSLPSWLAFLSAQNERMPQPSKN